MNCLVTEALAAALTLADGPGRVLDLGGSLDSVDLAATRDVMTLHLPLGSTRHGSSPTGGQIEEAIADSLASSAPDAILIGPSALAVCGLEQVLKATVAAVRRAADRQVGRPRVIVVARNWSASDVVRWLLCGGLPTDACPSGLRVGSPVTNQSLCTSAATTGLVSRQSSDISTAAHKATMDEPLPEHAPVGRLITHIGHSVGAAPDTAFFVRSFDIAPEEPAPSGSTTPGPTEAPPFLSVVVRTQGLRPQMLTEALTCLAAQEDQDFEVLLMAHSDDPMVIEAIDRSIGLFHHEFRGRVRVFHIRGGSRSAPLNRALDMARGAYVAFLDDDDLVTADWASSFKAAAAEHPGAVVRAQVREQRIERANRGTYRAIGPLEANYPDTYEHVTHFNSNSTPICSFAAPMAYVHGTSARFDESLAVLEDWDFLMQATNWCGVGNSPSITSIYHRWVSGASSRHIVPRRTWVQAREEVIAKLAATPVVFDVASAHVIAQAMEDADRVAGYEKWEKNVLRELERLRSEVGDQFEEIARLNDHIRDMTVNRNTWTRLRYRLRPKLSGAIRRGKEASRSDTSEGGK